VKKVKNTDAVYIPRPKLIAGFSKKQVAVNFYENAIKDNPEHNVKFKKGYKKYLKGHNKDTSLY